MHLPSSYSKSKLAPRWKGRVPEKRKRIDRARLDLLHLHAKEAFQQLSQQSRSSFSDEKLVKTIWLDDYRIRIRYKLVLQSSGLFGIEKGENLCNGESGANDTLPDRKADSVFPFPSHFLLKLAWTQAERSWVGIFPLTLKVPKRMLHK